MSLLGSSSSSKSSYSKESKIIKGFISSEAGDSTEIGSSEEESTALVFGLEAEAIAGIGDANNWSKKTLQIKLLVKIFQKE
jgi:hypothetical protein